MSEPILFDAVLFDLDGTLVATDRYWIPAARRAARATFRELGRELEVPSTREWLGIVGLPLVEGLARLFPALDGAELRTLEARCVREEEALVSAGGAALLPGVAEALDELGSAGVAVGIASNCGTSYLDHVRDALGLDRWFREMRCLDSPGIANKSEMLADLLETFGTRRAVMVGDRFGDEEAARANGLPHLHVRTGYASEREAESADRVLDDLTELLDVLRSRARGLERAIDEAGLAAGGLVALTGRRAAGKTLLAVDLARLLEARGLRVRVLALDEFRTGSPVTGEDPLAEGYDLERLEREVLEPGARLGPGEVWLLEGGFLLDPRVATRVRRTLYLAVPLELALARAAGRERGDPLSALEGLRADWAAEERFEVRFSPSRADLRLPAGVFELASASSRS